MAKTSEQPVRAYSMPKDPRPSQWEWQQQGLCRDVGPDVFFYEDHERGKVKQQRIKAALEICSKCAVIKQCKEFAITTGQQHGIWGGMTEEQLIVERRVRDDRQKRLTTII